MEDADDSRELARDALFHSLPGGSEVAEWFGFVPSFHDADMDRLELMNGSAVVVLKAFRMTSQIDSRGFFVLDRHATVTIALKDVTGVILEGNAASIISQLTIRRVSSQTPVLTTVSGPQRGDLEVMWESSYGLEGTLYAREVSLSLQPA